MLSFLLFLITENFPYFKIVAKLNQFISISKLLHTNIIFNRENNRKQTSSTSMQEDYAELNLDNDSCTWK